MSTSGVTEELDGYRGRTASCVVTVLDGPARGTQLVIHSGAEVIIGSGPSCALRLEDTAVSREHVRLHLQPSGGIVVRDLASTNGTLYLGTLIREVVVPLGAVLQLGRTRIDLRAGDVAEHEAERRASYGSIVGASAAMQPLYRALARVETTDHTVLITGETGVGKERVAQEIHAHSRRSSGPMVVFDCSAVSPQLIESELFGHVRGAFTGADRDREGAFVRAHGGTLFLDELGELPLELQPKLLRALEERRVRPVGGRAEQAVDVRVIAATNRDLGLEVEAGRFRRDLYFRVNVLQLCVPPLRERGEDVPLLVAHFLSQLEAPSFALSAASLEWLTRAYTWPGNVRELRNAVTRAVSLGDIGQLQHRQTDDVSVTGVSRDGEAFIDARRRVVEAFERDYLAHHLDKASQNIAHAARSAGLDRAYFRRLCVRHKLLR